MFDLAHYLVGDISRISAHVAAHVQRQGIDGQPIEAASDSASALLEFDNGAQGIVQLSGVAHTGNVAFEQQVALYGDSASLIADLKLGRDSPQLQLARNDEPFQAVTIPDRLLIGVDQEQPFLSQFEAMFRHQSIGSRLFIDGILENRSTVPSFYEGWKAQQVIDAALLAYESGHWVKV